MSVQDSATRFHAHCNHRKLAGSGDFERTSVIGGSSAQMKVQAGIEGVTSLDPQALHRSRDDTFVAIDKYSRCTQWYQASAHSRKKKTFRTSGPIDHIAPCRQGRTTLGWSDPHEWRHWRDGPQTKASQTEMRCRLSSCEVEALASLNACCSKNGLSWWGTAKRMIQRTSESELVEITYWKGRLLCARPGTKIRAKRSI